MQFHKTLQVLLLCLPFSSICLAQTPVSLTPAIERQFTKIESDILSAAGAMPADKFYFSPEDLHIKNSDFKGVRTFAGQIMHLATDNMLIWSAITGDSVRTDIEDASAGEVDHPWPV